MWLPIVLAAIILPIKIYVWSLPLAAHELLIASVPFGVFYLGACLWAIRKSPR